MLEDAETNNTKANLRLNKQETENEAKARLQQLKGGFNSDFVTSEMVSTPNSSMPGTRPGSHTKKLSGPYMEAQKGKTTDTL
jgi:hypothetical protein